MPAQKDNLLLRYMYHTVPGRVMLRAASGRSFSKVCGRFLDSPLSRPMVRRFVRRNHIDRSEYYNPSFRNFNEAFTRRIHEELRPLAADPNTLISPCDGHLSVYRIRDGLVVPIKQSWYTVSDLLGGDPIADCYRNGLCLVFRLCVNDYHRYCYIDDGVKGENTFLPGRLHTVRPIALEAHPVFVQNCREYTVMSTARFGEVTQVEVGALMVGKISNHHGPSAFTRGEEKGMFEYGGSTIVLLLEEGRANLPTYLFRSTQEGTETPVRMGEGIGYAAQPIRDPEIPSQNAEDKL